MVYEDFFWFMAALVALALVGGALFGRLGRLAHSVIAMLGLAIAIGVAVLLGARGEDVGPYAPLLAIAAFMFCLMIGGAATLVTRRVRRRHLTH